MELLSALLGRARKIIKINPEKIAYISRNGTFDSKIENIPTFSKKKAFSFLDGMKNRKILHEISV